MGSRLKKPVGYKCGSLLGGFGKVAPGLMLVTIAIVPFMFPPRVLAYPYSSGYGDYSWSRGYGYYHSEPEPLFSLNLNPGDSLNTSFRIAAREGRIEDMERLLHEGANINSASSEGVTALMYTGMFCKSRTARRLIELGADVNRLDHERRSALFYAAIFDCDPLVRIFSEIKGSKLTLRDAFEKSVIDYIDPNSELSRDLSAVIQKHIRASTEQGRRG